MSNSGSTPRTLRLTEYQTVTLPKEALSEQVGEQLWRSLDQAGKKLLVTFPSPKTANQWQLTAQGWVGQIQIPHQLTLRISPKLPLESVFRLWEMAYDVQLAELGTGLTAVSSIHHFFSILAQTLAQRVIQRGQHGFQRAYLRETAALPYVRGKLLPQQPATATPQLLCRYDAHTADIPDNQIIAYTLHQIARSGQCNARAQTAVRRAYHLLQPLITVRPFAPNDCQNRSYSRLNQNYAVLHALCRFFLEQTGPRLADGTHQIMPFLLNMAHLYERSIANWLKRNLPPPQQIKAQESTIIGPNDELRFQIDLTLYDGNGRPLAVLDTKYKTPDKPSQADISQVITYAKAKGCHHAVLIYPQPLPQPINVLVGDIHLHTLTFAPNQMVDKAGKQFLQQLQASVHL